MDFEVVDIEKDAETQVVLGHSGFIKTAEDLYEAMACSVPGIKFGVAFAEASGKRMVRTEGNDAALEAQAAKNMLAIRAGHTFIVLFRDAFPINVMKHIRAVDEVSRIYCATANPVRVVTAREGGASAVVGVMDGMDSVAAEDAAGREERRGLVRKIGYKK